MLHCLWRGYLPGYLSGLSSLMVVVLLIFTLSRKGLTLPEDRLP